MIGEGHGNCCESDLVPVWEGAKEVWESVCLRLWGPSGMSWLPWLAMKRAFKHSIRANTPHCRAWEEGVCLRVGDWGAAAKSERRLTLTGMDL